MRHSDRGRDAGATDGAREPMLSREQAAEYCGLSVRTLDRDRAARLVKCYKLGDGPRARVRFREADLDTYLERRAVAPRCHSGTDRQELLRLAERGEEILRTLRTRLVEAGRGD